MLDKILKVLDSEEDELEELNEQLEEGSWENIQEIENAISEVEGKIAKTKEKKKAFEWNIDAILNVISWTIVDENSQLEDIFKLVKWLGVENVISVLEFIIYLEWWFPDAYYDWWDGKIVKIWFLSLQRSMIWASWNMSFWSYGPWNSYTSELRWWDWPDCRICVPWP